MLIDLHVHSEFSFDSSEKISNYLERARELNVPVIGFSEHYDYDAFLDGENISLCDIPKYTDYLKTLKAKRTSPEILCGIEFGYRKTCVEQYRQLADSYNFDYIINSVHTLSGRGDCFHDAFFEGKTLKESYFDYLKAVLESVRADFDYQIIGHIGYVSRYRTGEGSRIIYSDFAEILDEILKEIIARDKCLEINTSTGHSAGLALPDTVIIERYLQLGGEKLSFGSDAHSVDGYLRKNKELIGYLKSVGIYRLFYYKNRRPCAYNI